MSYDELAAMVNSMPRIPKRALKCHPLVVTRLREETRAQEAQGSSSYPSDLYRLYNLTAMLVLMDSDMDPGAWKIYEDGGVVAEGNTETDRWKR